MFLIETFYANIWKRFSLKVSFISIETFLGTLKVHRMNFSHKFFSKPTWWVLKVISSKMEKSQSCLRKQFEIPLVHTSSKLVSIRWTRTSLGWRKSPNTNILNREANFLYLFSWIRFSLRMSNARFCKQFC